MDWDLTLRLFARRGMIFGGKSTQLLAAHVQLHLNLLQGCNTPECYLRIFLVIFYKEQSIQWMKVVLKINGDGELQV
jgi:hypothetical protein